VFVTFCFHRGKFKMANIIHIGSLLGDTISRLLKLDLKDNPICVKEYLEMDL
jgi:hypothetical protein